MVCLDANIVIYLVEQNPFWEPKVAVLELRFSVAPKGPKQESPGQRPGLSIRMRIHPALKGRNKILVHTLVVPLQGVAILITQSRPQGVALGWHVAAPSGRNPRSATPKGRGPDCGVSYCRRGDCRERRSPSGVSGRAVPDRKRRRPRELCGILRRPKRPNAAGFGRGLGKSRADPSGLQFLGSRRPSFGRRGRA